VEVSAVLRALGRLLGCAGLVLAGLVAFAAWVANRPPGLVVYHDPTALAVAPVWLDARKAEVWQDGRVFVDLYKFGVARVPLEILGQPGASEQEHAILGVRVTCNDPNAKVDFQSWAESLFARPTIKDEHGNVYRLIDFGFGTTVAGAVKSASVRANEPAVDVIVFEKPVAGAKELFIELPASRLGRAGTIRFKLTIAEPVNPRPLPAG
jgi:hypothetical protein